MGYASHIPTAVEGRNYARLFQGETSVDRPTFQPYYKIPRGHPELGSRGVRTARHTLVIHREKAGKETIELYDRTEDPYQLKNLAAEQPETVQDLRASKLNPWLKGSADPWLVS